MLPKANFEGNPVERPWFQSCKLNCDQLKFKSLVRKSHPGHPGPVFFFHVFGNKYLRAEINSGYICFSLCHKNLLENTALPVHVSMVDFT